MAARARRTCRLEHLQQLRFKVIVRPRRGRVELVRNFLDHPPHLDRVRKLLLERSFGVLAALHVLEVVLAQRLLARLYLLAQLADLAQQLAAARGALATRRCASAGGATRRGRHSRCARVRGGGG